METPVPNFYFMGVQFLHLLALVVWVGGIVILQSIVAPALICFSSSRQFAALILREVYNRFHRTTLVCAAVLLASSGIKFLRWENLTPWNSIRYSAIFVMTSVAIYMNLRLFPQLYLAEDPSAASNIGSPVLPAAELNRLHVLSDRLMMTSLICGVTAILLA